MYLILLYKSGKFKKVKLEKLTQKDLEKAKYLMVPVNTMYGNRNYVVIHANHYKNFTKALVSYQFCISAEDEDYINPYEFEFQPVYKEVDNIIDLFNLMNGIYSLTLVNTFINGNDHYDGEWTGLFGVRISFFHVTLYNGDMKSNEYGYELKPSSSSFFDPCKVCNVFKKLYEIDIDIFDSYDDVFIFYEDNTWDTESIHDLSSYEYDCGIVGIPSHTNYNIYLLSSEEVRELNAIKDYEVVIHTFFESVGRIEKMEEYIDNGLYNLIFRIMEMSPDHFYTQYIRGNKTTKYPLRVIHNLLDFFSYNQFIHQFITVIFSELYGPVSGKEDDNFELFIHFTINREKRFTSQIGTINSRTLVIDEFLYLLQK